MGFVPDLTGNSSREICRPLPAPARPTAAAPQRPVSVCQAAFLLPALHEYF